uniref:G protein-coupled receptor n=1 Tax=Syphacia muris TaxID=451379 RepID=A0A0N5AGJ2_9BILA
MIIALTYCVEGGNISIGVVGPVGRLLPAPAIIWFLYMFHFLLAVGVLTFHVGFGFQYCKICRKQLFGFRYEANNILRVYLCLLILALIIEIINAPSMQVVHIENTQCFNYKYDVFQLKREKKDAWRVTFFALTLVGAAFISLIIIIFTSTQTFRALRLQHFRQKTNKLQRKFTTMMLLQAILPMIAVIVPFLIYAWTLVVPTEIGSYGTLVFAFFYWQPCIHSLITLCFLKPFYKELSITDIFKFSKRLSRGTT